MNLADSSSQHILKIARETSVLRLRELSRLGTVAATDFQPTDSGQALGVFGHWLSFILLSGEGLRMIFKVHYQTAKAQYFAAQAYGTEQASVSKLRALDFMKEYCNLTMGSLKIQLEAKGFILGVSLPCTTRGFDELFFRRSTHTQVASWKILAHSADSSDSIEIVCSIEFELFGSALISAADEADPKLQEDTSSGEIDFF